MNEITRIHIAKIPYDIEITAKKEIERYIKSLELYADDIELLRDIEIRITELLALRSVVANGVISNDDVTAIREQLGEPKDFMNGDVDLTYDKYDDDGIKRRLYRNVDNAILGGVLSGIASFFRVNPIWTRLIFVALFIVSAGTVGLAYIMLWIIMPPARTATEKLQMSGRSVTLNSIREFNEDESTLALGYERANFARHFILMIAGIACLVLSILTVLLTVVTALNIIRFNIFGGIQTDVSWIYICSYVLAILSGLLLATLFAVCSYMIFSHKYSKKLLISIVFIIMFGLVSFGTAVGLMSYQSSQVSDILQQSVKEKSINLPLTFASTKFLTVDASLANVNYIVSDTYKIVLRSLPGAKEPVISTDGSTLIINLISDSAVQWTQMKPILTIYGPKLDKLTIRGGEVTYSAGVQDLVIEADGQAMVNLTSGTYKNLSIVASDQSYVDVSVVTVESAIVDSRLGSHVLMGTIKSLSVIQPEACPIDANTSIDIQHISSGVMSYNGNKISAKTYNTDCGSVIFGDTNN